jgi:glycosyltransferase involved in cell wall biosynthesis
MVPQALLPAKDSNIEKTWFTKGELPELNPAIVAERVDCIVLAQQTWNPAHLRAGLDRLMGVLNSHGQLAILINNHPVSAQDETQLDDLLSQYDLIRYHIGSFTEEGASTPAWALTAVGRAYNPVSHARQLALQGRPDIAIEILDLIPSNLIENEDLLAGLSLEKQKFYFQWQQKLVAPELSHALFSKERREFAQVTALKPVEPESYRLHAKFWSYLGREDMAARLLRSLASVVVPDTETNQLLSDYESKRCAPAGSCTRPESHAVWDERWPAPRILVLCHDRSDYGLDTLYHGLCNILGKENVVEYPWKSTLHGRDFASAAGYPCVFDYPGQPIAVDELIAQLRQGRFDLVLYSDVIRMTDREAVRQLMKAAAHIPAVLYDTWDDCYTPLQRVLDYTRRERFELIFKREMLAGVTYAPDTYPLPFSYPEALIDTVPPTQKIESFFWAGKSEYGLRPIYIRQLENIAGHRLDKRYDQAAYRRKLRSSHMGISFFGCGFDTVRYWELPANGVMLLAERPPIIIPDDFEDGISAVFFDDLPELEEKIKFYRQRPEEMARIAAAGHAHYLRHHTSSARARQFLGVVAEKLSGWKADLIRKTGVVKPALVPVATLHLGLVKGENYGWGVCSRYLIKELSKQLPVAVVNPEDGSSENPSLSGVLFQALTNVDFDPMFPKARAQRNFGYTFFENELTERSRQRAKHFDKVLGGSTWCIERMREHGIANCDLLIQGIDPEIFYPIDDPPDPERFVIFSGGKFELRKGQDLVLRAVKIMQDRYPDVWLVNCWYNLWPASTRLMGYSPHIRFDHRDNENWTDTMARTYAANGLDSRRIVTCELMPQSLQRDLYSRTDIGLFPNRCEGGTNLVLMEYMACAKPVIASNASGHKDIVNDGNALLLNRLTPFNLADAKGGLVARWQEPSLDEIVAQLEHAYQHREEIRQMGVRAGNELKGFTWGHSARRLLEIMALNS